MPRIRGPMNVGSGSVPKPARVMLLSYNSSPAICSSGIDLDDHAKNLLHWGVPSRRPLVFICHSLGGLVVKQALIEATANSTSASIAEATCLLVFVATPHQGGDYASAGDVMAKAVRVSLRKPSNDLLRSLKHKSDEATSCSTVIEQIKEALLPSDKSVSGHPQRRFVITGLGGQGKSEICLRVADLLRDEFWGVFCADISTISTAATGFRAISEMLGAPTESTQDACRLLSNAREDWLLILDNADDPEFDYQRYFPSVTRSAVIMTSRVRECKRYNTVGFIELGGLDEDDCVTILLRAAETPRESWLANRAEAREIVRELGLHTLALIQAGTYICQSQCPIGDYIQQYQRECERLLKFSPKQAQPRYCNVYATFEASTHYLQSLKSEVAHNALDFLGILSLLHYGDILYRFLKMPGWAARKSEEFIEKKQISRP
ncbi:hypothetical protein AJ80_05916 [Polytolypa hystricis UAMH7299]|uniref:NB-ARC domain-containing protein n=1 Tax=Polytolypa hystricis (strain UAMH7299) TaxID=1447883 RepID=A0A2B7Y0B7_POLH7|nr:hypothetical protein AJ80_05916 [Polytolypa hystricis UAMH7299]